MFIDYRNRFKNAAELLQLIKEVGRKLELIDFKDDQNNSNVPNVDTICGGTTKNDHENGDHGIKSGNHENGSGYHKSGNGDGDDENHKELKQFLKGGHYKAGSSDLEYEIGYFDQLLEKGESDSFYGYNDSEIIVDEAGSLRFKKGDKSQYSTFRAVFVEKQMPQFTEGLLEAPSSTISSILGMLEFWSTIVQNGRGDVVGLP